MMGERESEYEGRDDSTLKKTRPAAHQLYKSRALIRPRSSTNTHTHTHTDIYSEHTLVYSYTYRNTRQNLFHVHTVYT